MSPHNSGMWEIDQDNHEFGDRLRYIERIKRNWIKKKNTDVQNHSKNKSAKLCFKEVVLDC